MTLSADDLAKYLEIGSYADVDRSNMTLAVDAAVRAVAQFCGRDFTAPANTTSVRKFRASSGPVYTDDFVDDPTLVEYSFDRDTWTTVTDSWWTEPDNKTTRYAIHGLLRSNLTQPMHWRVTAKWGVDAEMIAEAKLPTLMKAARLYQRRKSPDGIQGFGEFGAVRITRAADPDVADLLGPLVRMDRAGIA